MAKDIEHLEKQIEAKREELEGDVRRFIAACMRFAEDMLESKVRSAIHSHPERVEEIGEAGLKKMKGDVAEAHGQMEELVESLVNRDELWAHRKDDFSTKDYEFGSYYQHGNRLPDQVEDQIRLLLSPAGRILTEHQLANPQDWENRGGLQRYRYGIGWSDDQKSIMKSYGEKFSQLWRLIEEKEQLLAQKKGNQALRQWDDL